MGNRLAGVGIRDPTVDDFGRLQGHGHWLRPGTAVRIDHDPVPREPRVFGHQEDANVLANTTESEAPFGVGDRRARPGRQAPGGIPTPENGTLVDLVGNGIRASGAMAHAFDRHPDALDGPAMQVEQPPLNYLFGSERDVGGRLIGIEVDVDPADPVAGRDRSGAAFVMGG